MKTIVVGYDGSETAKRAVAEAANLANVAKADLHVINVVNDAAMRQGLSNRELDEQAKREAIAMTNELLTGTLKGALSDSSIVTKVVFGSPGRSIVDYASAVSADVIVVGNRRVQGLERLLGSVAIEVLRMAPCSVHVAHTKQEL